MTAPAEDPRGGEADPCSMACDTALCNFPLCFAADTPPAAGRGDTDSGGAIEPGLSAESNARRLAWFTDAELAAELTRRALDGA